MKPFNGIRKMERLYLGNAIRKQRISGRVNYFMLGLAIAGIGFLTLIVFGFLKPVQILKGG